MRDVEIRLPAEIESRFDTALNAYMNRCRVHDLPVRVSRLPEALGAVRTLRFLSSSAAGQFSSWWAAQGEPGRGSTLPA